MFTSSKHDTQALNWLGCLRGSTDRYDSSVGYLRQLVEKGGLSLADIGTSEEELLAFRRNVPIA